MMMKTRKRIKQLTGLIMAFLFLFSLPLTAFASNSENPEQLVNVTVSDTENETIIAQVPQKYVAEYQEKLKNDDFKQEQIEMMRRSQDSGHLRALPDGKIIAQKYLYESDIRRALERVEPGLYDSLIANFAPSVAFDKMLKAFGVSNPYAFVGQIVNWAVEYVRVKPELWWRDSLIMIMGNQISSVRVSHIQNLKPTYPAAWIILERMA